MIASAMLLRSPLAGAYLYVMLLIFSSSALATSSPGLMDRHLRSTDGTFVPQDNDGDGVPNAKDAFPLVSSEWFDTDGDGVGNNADTDDDGDGMSDAFELANNLDPLSADGSYDYDGDGSTNLQEFQAGTSPTNFASCISFCLFDPPPTPATISFPSHNLETDLIGAVPGQINVANSGAAEYTIPLIVPAGTAGVAPRLAIQYRSNGGSGILGEGWSLGALSSITRCPQSRAQDGIERSVTLDSGDRFCLDGARLVLVTPGATYGASGAEYRTENDSFTKVVSVGALGGGPQYFNVWNKDGSFSQYGFTADSRLTNAVAGGAALVWAQNSIENATSANSAVKNLVTYTYDSSGSRNLQIQSIKYGAPGDINRIDFIYEARPDTKVSYLKTLPYNDNQRLSDRKSVV